MMKKILFLLLLTTGTTHAQDYQLKIRSGYAIATDVFILDSMKLKINTFKLPHDFDSLGVAQAMTSIYEKLYSYIDEDFKRGRLHYGYWKSGLGRKPQTDIDLLINVDRDTGEISEKVLRVKFMFNRTCECTLYFVTHGIRKGQFELYLIPEGAEHGWYNLTTGQFLNNRKGKRAWEYFVEHNGFPFMENYMKELQYD